MSDRVWAVPEIVEHETLNWEEYEKARKGRAQRVLEEVRLYFGNEVT